MREIKFRSWDGKFMGYSHDGWNESTDVFSELWDILQSHYGHSVMQYTGLRDKNGKEIYEGDIVRCESGEICEIPSEMQFSVTNNCVVWGYRVPFVGFEPTEVIGNIHETPELLESP